MALNDKPYRRLTRSSASVATYKSLWLGADHLLVVSSTGYHETYRRIQFKDIQGIFTIATQRRGSWALGWAVIAGFSGIVAIAAAMTGGVPVFSLGFAVVGLVGLLWNYLLGPGCKVFLITGVQTLQLPSLVRQRKARRVLGELAPLVAAAQPSMAPTPAPVQSAEDNVNVSSSLPT